MVVTTNYLNYEKGREEDIREKKIRNKELCKIVRVQLKLCNAFLGCGRGI